MENMKMKRKRDKKKFDLPRQGFEPRIFEQVPAQNLNFEGDYVEKFHKYYCFFHWNPYLKIDSAYLVILFSVNKKRCRNFYVIFLRNVSAIMYVLHLEIAENQKP